MKLIGSVTSPFVRFVRVSLAELDVDHEFRKTGPFGLTSEEDHTLINASNPLMKVPVLVVDDQHIIDSRVIVTWLLQRHATEGNFGFGFPENLGQDNALSTIYGVLDAAILKFIMINAHPEIDPEGPYLARSMQRVQHALDWLDTKAGLGPDFGPNEALLLCALEWMRKRAVYDWSGHANLVALHAAHGERPSLVNTRIPDTI